MVRIRWIVTMALTAVFLLAGLETLSAYAADGLTTTLTTMTNGTGYHATYAITNQTSTTIRDWQVAFILPTDARITGSAGAMLTSSGQLVFASSTGQASEIASGATVSFSFDVTGGAAPPFACTVNGVQCQPAQPSPSPTPTPTGSAPAASVKPSPSAPPTTPATPSPSTATATSSPPTPAPPTATATPTGSPTPTGAPSSGASSPKPR